MVKKSEEDVDGGVSAQGGESGVMVLDRRHSKLFNDDVEVVDRRKCQSSASGNNTGGSGMYSVEGGVDVVDRRSGMAAPLSRLSEVSFVDRGMERVNGSLPKEHEVVVNGVSIIDRRVQNAVSEISESSVTMGGVGPNADVKSEKSEDESAIRCGDVVVVDRRSRKLKKKPVDTRKRTRDIILNDASHGAATCKKRSKK